MYSLYSLIPLLVSMIPSAKAAGYQGKVVGTNIGCDIKGLTADKGFDATFYSYTYNDVDDYQNTNFYAGEFENGGVINSAAGVDPNFNYNEGALTTATSEIWGVDLPITNFVADFSGYFYGMYYFFSFSLLCRFRILTILFYYFHFL